MRYLELFNMLGLLNKRAILWKTHPGKADEEAEAIIRHTANPFYNGSARIIQFANSYYNFRKSPKSEIKDLVSKISKHYLS